MIKCEQMRIEKRSEDDQNDCAEKSGQDVQLDGMRAGMNPVYRNTLLFEARSNEEKQDD